MADAVQARRLCAGAIALALLAGCAAPDDAPGDGLRAGPVRGGEDGARTSAGGRSGPAPRGRDGVFDLAFDDTRATEVFDEELLGRRDRAGGTQGLWVTVAGLRRAETAEIVNLATGAAAKVALFPGAVRTGEARISSATAALIGIGAEPVRVRITALRREPVLTAP